MAKKAEVKNEFFDDLKAGLTAAIEHAEGRRKDLRTTTLPRPPKELSASEIAKVVLPISGFFCRYRGENHCVA